MESLKSYLKRKINSVNGVVGIVLSDKEGVPVLKSTRPEGKEPSPQLLSVLSHAGDQGIKLGLGKNKLVIANFQSYQVVQMNYSPIIVSVFASEDANTGQIIQMVNGLQPFVQSVSEAVF